MGKLSNFICTRGLPGVAAACFLLAGLAAAQGLASTEPSASALIEKHAELKEQLERNQYRRPLFLESSQSANTVDGSVYAILASPFGAFSSTFKSPRQWCEVMILHLNNKYCRANADTAPTRLNVNIGKKSPQELKDAFALEFGLNLVAASPAYLSVLLSADKGPLGTSNYRMALQAVPLPDNRTFMHLRYSYDFGAVSSLAMQAYLATVGRGKVGFTQVSQGDKPAHIGGMRGAAERNIMRYYLAIEAYQASLAQPAAEQLNARLQSWFDATEEYPQQLREVDKASYLGMKKMEHQRQETVLPPG